MLKDI